MVWSHDVHLRFYVGTWKNRELVMRRMKGKKMLEEVKLRLVLVCFQE